MQLLRFSCSIYIDSYLTLSWRRPLSYRNQSIDLLRKSMDKFPYDNGLRHERVKGSDYFCIFSKPGQWRRSGLFIVNFDHTFF